MPAPELPDWCLEEEEGLSDNEEQNGETLEDGSRPDGSRKRIKRDPRLKVSLSLCNFLLASNCCYITVKFRELVPFPTQMFK